MMRRLEPDSAHISLVDGILTEQHQLGRYIDAIENLGQQRLPNGPETSTATCSLLALLHSGKA